MPDNRKNLLKSLTRKSAAAVVVSFVTLYGGVAVADTLNIQGVELTKDAGQIPDKVRAECKLEFKLGTYLKKYGSKNFDKVTNENKAVAGAKNLKVKVVSTTGAPGGSWSGAKGAYISGTITENGKTTGSFEAQRTTGAHGGWGFGRGTCKMLGKVTASLGRDVAEWAKSPSMNARLGELK